MRVTGVDGRDLHQGWREGAEAFLGMSVAGFPNLFMLSGPNTYSIHNSIVYLIERQARYITAAIRHLVLTGARWVDVRAEVQREFNAKLQRKLRRTVFTADCHSWFKTPSGKVTGMWPGSHLAYARATRRFDPGAYRHGPKVQAGGGQPVELGAA
jgi:hypothetical protein